MTGGFAIAWLLGGTNQVPTDPRTPLSKVEHRPHSKETNKSLTTESARESSETPATKQLHIHEDGRIIYRNGEVYDYGLAMDASSYFVVEPMVGETSRLVTRDFLEGSQRTYDISHIQNHLSPRRPLPVRRGRYTRDGSEVMFTTARSRIGEWLDFHFFAVGKRQEVLRQVRVEDPRDGALFESSWVGYFSHVEKGGKFAVITKRS